MPIHVSMHTCVQQAHMYMCIHACMCTCMHMHAHVRAHVHVHVHRCICACMHTCVHACAHVCTDARLHACSHAGACACTSARVHAHMHPRGRSRKEFRIYLGRNFTHFLFLGMRASMVILSSPVGPLVTSRSRSGLDSLADVMVCFV